MQVPGSGVCVATARVAGVANSSACGAVVSGPVLELGCWSGEVPFCGLAAGCFCSGDAGVLPVVPIFRVLAEGVSFCPLTPVLEVVLLCRSSIVVSGTSGQHHLQHRCERA